MLRLLASQLRFRPGRSAAFAIGIAVAAVAFTLLTASARTSALRVRGTISRSYRAAYDILVRPRGAATPLERQQGLVRNNYLSGIYGGITFEQYREIAGLDGVDVAAPIANVGFAFPLRIVQVSVNEMLTKEPFQLYRIRTTWLANGGMSRYPAATYYVYYTRRDRFVLEAGSRALVEVGPRRPPTRSYGGFVDSGPLQPTGPWDSRFRTYFFAFSARSRIDSINFGLPDRDQPGFVGGQSDAYFPISVAAVDPKAEAKLVHLDRTMVAGRYLRPSDGTSTHSVRRGTFRSPPLLPVLASERTFVDERLAIEIERLRVPAGTDVPRALASGACLSTRRPCPERVGPPRGASYSNAREFLARLEGRTAARRSVPIGSIYEQLLRGRNGRLPPGVIGSDYWTASQVRYRTLGRDHLAPIPVRNPPDIWVSQSRGHLVPPLDNRDVQFRRLSERQLINLGGFTSETPGLRVVGRFDPRKLPGFSPLSKVPLETYSPPELQPADAAARKALGGRPLLPTQNLGDYVAQPPLLLTALPALKRFFVNPHFIQGVPRRQQRAPISVVRVRVKGVKGPDPLSRARVRVVAQQIHDRTGLDVDITAGSSPHPLLISLPQGRFGRPPLLLREGWSKKGVSVVFLDAVDRKSLALFALVLVVCCFFLANGAFAAARARRSEVGVLRTLGWSQLAIFRALLGELALIGALAGIVGTALGAALVPASSLDLPLAHTLLVLPLSLALACVAGLVPVWRAAQTSPLEAVRSEIAGDVRRRRVRRIAVLALVNLRRLPVRTVVAAAGLAIGAAALTLLLGIERAFHGTLVGTLLGNTISLQVRGVDLVAVLLTIALAAISVADVLYLNLQERAAEFVTLRTTGWSEAHLMRLVAWEALGLGLAGSLAGAACGLVLGAILLDVPVGSLALAAGLAAVCGTATALCASLLPLSQIRRLTPAAVLAAE